jgi:hypothetical protein
MLGFRKRVARRALAAAGSNPASIGARGEGSIRDVADEDGNHDGSDYADGELAHRWQESTAHSVNGRSDAQAECKADQDRYCEQNQ